MLPVAVHSLAELMCERAGLCGTWKVAAEYSVRNWTRVRKRNCEGCSYCKKKLVEVVSASLHTMASEMLWELDDDNR